MKTIQTLAEYHEQYQLSVDHPEKFWASVADTFTWKKKWDKVLEWDFIKPTVKWFEGAET